MSFYISGLGKCFGILKSRCYTWVSPPAVLYNALFFLPPSAAAVYVYLCLFTILLDVCSPHVWTNSVMHVRIVKWAVDYHIVVSIVAKEGGRTEKKKGIPNARWMLVCAWKIIINESRRALATDEKCDWIPFRLDRAFDSHRRYGLVVLIHRLGKFSYVICEDRLDGYRSGGVLCSTSPIIIFDLLFLITNRFRLGSSRSFFFFFFKKTNTKVGGGPSEMLMSSPIGPFRRTVIYCQVAKETCVLLFRLCFHTHWVLSKMWLNCIDRKRQRMLSAWDSDAPPPLPLTFSLSFLRLTRVLIVSLCKVHAPPLSLSLSLFSSHFADYTKDVPSPLFQREYNVIISFLASPQILFEENFRESICLTSWAC